MITRSRRLCCWLVVFAFCASPVSLTAESVAGNVSSLEGDRLMLSDMPVQIEALHCPTMGEPGGWEATRRISKLFDSATVTCALTGKRSFSGEVGKCSVNGRDVAAQLIEVGVCARCERHDPDGVYVQAERAAGNEVMWSPSYCRMR